MSITTRTGDSGKTSLIGETLVSKASPRPEAIGSVDECSSWLGLLAVDLTPRHRENVLSIQKDLFKIGAELAAVRGVSLNIMLVGPGDVARLETWCRELEKEIVPLKGLVLPGGGGKISALVDVARAVCRRAERRVVGLLEREGTLDGDVSMVVYLNRLSDYLFLLARSLDTERCYAAQ
ncbi:cob(I)yrinic acid a,c-diamide adenosyltransferase [Myxococcota bacterium]|nr:cob(I)yrinic acid a,c-diamide adenosyltransferase [Myxococcota bacterium]MBU1534468.1 cob(I)yrinic acid a,c-diamide adenosyltransferase [Myxococcota bacterium]